MNTILGVITDWDLASQVFNRAKQFAKAYSARLRIYCPVSDQLEEMNRYIGFDNYESVKQEILAEANRRLEALVGDDQNIDWRVDWQTHRYKGVAEQAESHSADLIVMTMSQHHILADLLHKADDWHLLREAPCPVMLLSRAEHPFKSVVAAVDSLDESEEHQSLNGRILDEAQSLSKMMALPLQVISVVPDPAYIYGDMSATTLMVDYRTQAVNTARDNQSALLSRLGISPDKREVMVGRVEAVLEEAVKDTGILVLGTIANKGWKGFFLGNTAERILGRIEGDVLVVN